MPETHDPYAALRSGGYRCLLAGSVLASMATEMQRVAIGWELYQRTNDPAALGLVGLVQFLPVFLLSLPAGHAADRFSRKGLLVAAQGLMAGASLGLAALSACQGPIPLVYLCVLGAGLGQAFSSPARWALVPQVVPERDIGNAITWNTSGWQVASMAGPALGGMVMALTGRAVDTYVLAAGCALAGAGLLLPVRPRVGRRAAGGLSLRSLLAGIQFVWSTKVILATITLDLFAVLLGGAVALLPVYARDILHVGPGGLGWLQAAPSVGAILMAVALAHRPPLRRAGRALLWSVAGFGAATVVFGLSHNIVLSFVMLALTGALDNVSMVVRGTLVQLLTPDHMRGRVSAVNSIFISSSNELGAFESGLTARLFGPVLSVVGGGIGTILVVIGVMLVWPQVLRLGPLDRPTEETEPEATPAPDLRVGIPGTGRTIPPFAGRPGDRAGRPPSHGDLAP
jgi:MFS family permease